MEKGSQLKKLLPCVQSGTSPCAGGMLYHCQSRTGQKSNDRAGVPPVSIHVIVRSAHSALVRKLYYPRSLFIVYDLSVCPRRRHSAAPAN